jgi:hypothetical protein
VVGQVVSEEWLIDHRGAERACELLTLIPVSLVVCIGDVFCTSSAPENELIQGVHGKSRGLFGGYKLGFTLWARVCLPGPLGDTVFAEQILTFFFFALGNVQIVHDRRTD